MLTLHNNKIFKKNEKIFSKKCLDSGVKFDITKKNKKKVWTKETFRIVK